MPSIVIRLDPRLLTDPNLDLRYEIPDRLAELSGGLIEDAGYDYEIGNEVTGQEAMHIYLETSDLARAVPLVTRFLETERLFGNDLAAAAVVGVSEEDAGEAKAYAIRYPAGRTDVIPVRGT